MWIKELSLSDFRSYPLENFSFERGVNFFYGENGAGKTNVLEAISFLSMGKSFVTSDEKNCIAEGKLFARIEAIYEKEDSERKIEVLLSKDGKKIRLGNQDLKKLSEMSGNVLLVSFSPRDVRFFQDSPQERRKMMDVALTMLEKTYLPLISSYRELLKQRNALLKGEENEMLLEVLENQMIPLEKKITFMRYQLICNLEEEIKKMFQQFETKFNSLKLMYRGLITDEKQLEYFEDNIKDQYRRTRTSDRLHGSTMIGIHKDDMQLYLDEKNIAQIGSRGQNRLSALLLKLALSSLIRNKKKEEPILLLDDVLSELDEWHIAKLNEILKDKEQVFITGTMVPPSMEKDCTMYQVEQHKAIRR